MESQYHRFASIAPWLRLLLKSWTPCFDMKEDRSKKSALVCDGWSGFLEVASDLPRALNRKGKEYYLIWFLAWRGWVDCSLARHECSEERRDDWRQSFRLLLLPRGRGVVMAIMVGSFTSQLPTSTSVATLLAFAKPWRYCTLGGNFFTFGRYWRCGEVNC